MKNQRFPEIRGGFTPTTKVVCLLLTIIGTVTGGFFCSIAQAQSYKVAWAQRTSEFGDGISDLSTAVDNQGNFFASGSFSSPILTIGNTTLTNSNVIPPGYTAMDSFVVKYSSNGELLWVRQITGSGQEVVNGCATDNEGNLFVAGVASSTNTLIGTNLLITGGPGPVYLPHDAFLAKYDAAGNVLWARQLGGSTIEANCIAIDEWNNAVIVGRFGRFILTTSWLFGTNSFIWSGTNPNDKPDAFIAKYSGTGDPLWARQIKTRNSITPSVGIDHQNNIYISDSFVGSADFGDLVLTNSQDLSDFSLFLAKYDPAGKALWAHTAAVGGTMPNDMVVDPQGNSYLVGEYSNPTLLVGAITLTNQGGVDSWLAKFDNAGNLAWASPIGSPWDDEVKNVALDKVGNCYVFGDSDSAVINFGNFISTSPEEYFQRYRSETFMAKYSGDGSALWARKLFSPSVGTVGWGKVDSLGTIYVGGSFGGFTNVFHLDDVTLNLPKPSPTRASSGYFFTKLNGPMLSASSSGNQLTLSWPTNAVGLHLESTTNLNGPWSAATNAPSVTTDQNSVALDASNGSRFFRLNGP